MKNARNRTFKTRQPKMTGNSQVAEMQAILDGFVRDGIAWKGPDGRYRIREDVEVVELPDGTIQAIRKDAQ
ncbi:MAG: hypothetical protein C0491_02535 [Novosphingobium sp.]|nr:hypothetical protein [Novosphingobium sp.]